MVTKPDSSECGCVTADDAVGSCYCVLEPLVQAVGRRHGLQVLNVIAAKGRVHFTEIQRQLAGLSSSTLTARLDELQAVGLVIRSEYVGEPPRSEYALSPKGQTLRDSLRRLFPER